MKFEIFFLSYCESNREKNWQRLKKKIPLARRIHGVRGLALAHQMCAGLSNTDFFFVVNADNELCEDFHFESPKQKLNPKVYCWRSLNPVNGLLYGYGGVKLFPKKLLLSVSRFVDLSTSLKGSYQIVNKLASVTCFNVSPLEAWRGAFRECVKLSSECIAGQKSKETNQRLKIWCEKGAESHFGDYVLLGAKQGKEYGLKNKENKKALYKINDFVWLKNQFLQNN